MNSFPSSGRKINEECGVFGIFGTEEAAKLTALGLHALQHRGQEATGIVSFDDTVFHAHRAFGKVGDVFSKPRKMELLKGRSAIGHNRYSTSGDASAMPAVQPLFAETDGGGMALAHNGNFTNAMAIRQKMIRQGHIFQSNSDTEVLLHLVSKKKGQLPDRLIGALHELEGAFSLVALSSDALIGIRDARGMRPLVLGKIGSSYVLASESCALDIMDATWIRDIAPGEMVIINAQGLHSYRPFPDRKQKFCVFEYIYFSRPDSILGGRSVYETRKKIGRELALEAPADADLVSPVPDSGVASAIGYSAEINLPFEHAITRNHYIGRTFIEPSDEIRHFGVKLKHNANRNFLVNKRVVLVDDSIVRGTTSRKIVEMVKQAGATEVHMRIASPPITHSCFYGVDTPEQKELLAHTHSVEAMRDYLQVASLAFLSPAGLFRAIGDEGGEQKRHCDACFTGNYPTDLVDFEGGTKNQLSLLSEL